MLILFCVAECESSQPGTTRVAVQDKMSTGKVISIPTNNCARLMPMSVLNCNRMADRGIKYTNNCARLMSMSVLNCNRMADHGIKYNSTNILL